MVALQLVGVFAAQGPEYNFIFKIIQIRRVWRKKRTHLNLLISSYLPALEQKSVEMIEALTPLYETYIEKFLIQSFHWHLIK